MRPCVGIVVLFALIGGATATAPAAAAAPAVAKSSAVRPGAAASEVAAGSGYANLAGDIVLENDRVLVRAVTIPPGVSTGAHRHRHPELLVFVRGGVLKSEATGRPVLWRDGRVVWMDASVTAEAGATNTGDAPIELREVVLKPAAATADLPARAAPVGAAKQTAAHLVYPNIPLEDVFENDRVIVQRFVMNPGQWEGVHGHRPNTLYVYIKGGPWATRTQHPPSLETGDTPDGYTGWMPPIDIQSGHESGNTGSSPSDIVWIALKD